MAFTTSRSIDLGRIVDLSVLSGAWIISIGALVWAVEDGERTALVTVTLMAFLIAPLNALYLQIRLAPQLAALAQKARREELAVTLLPAQEYLSGQLKWPFFCAVAPMATLLPFYCVTVVILTGLPRGLLSAGLIYSGLLLSVLLISLAGTFDLFARLLRRNTEPGPALLLIPVGWCLAAVGAPVGGIFTIGVLPWLTGAHGDGFIGLGFLLGFALNISAITIAVRRWETACRRYYQFDDD